MQKKVPAVIPVAGWGARRLPITKVVEKCMLPVGNRPIIDYVVEDCIKAGITTIIFVVGQDSEQVKSYYTRHERLEDYLRNVHKEGMIPDITPDERVTFHFVEQPQDGRYGTSIPVALAAEKYDLREGAIVMMGDDFIYHQDDVSEAARLLAAAGAGSSSLLGVEVPAYQVSHYGVIDVDAQGHFKNIVEKPDQKDAPSNLINVSKYFMSGELISYVQEHVGETLEEGEYQITEPINRYVSADNVMKVVPAAGQYLDGGTVEGWLHANNVVCGVVSV